MTSTASAVSRRTRATMLAALCVIAPYFTLRAARAQAPATTQSPALDTATPGVPAQPSATPGRSAALKQMAHNGFAHLTSLALPEAEAAPLLTPVSTRIGATSQYTVRAAAKGFTDAPVPDDDTDAPQDRTDNTAPSLEPSFFHHDAHQVGAALANGAGDNDQRRGTAHATAGVALAIPLN